MEKEILKLGRQVSGSYQVNENIDEKKVLVLVTQLFKYGGHSKLLTNYINKLHDLRKIITIAVSSQGTASIPEEILGLKARGIISELIIIDETEPSEKIRTLRKIVALNHEVFLFISQDDVITCAALSFKYKPYTYFINHADHTFWLGVSVIDELIDFRQLGQEISLRKRGFKGLSKILPLTLNDRRVFDKAESRARLNLGEDDVVLVIMASAFKLRPDGEYNIFNVIKYALSQSNSVKFLIVGMTQDEYNRLSGINVPENVFCYGVLEDFSEVISAGDFVVDTFPLNSYMALLECLRCDLVPILHWGPFSENMSLDRDVYLEGLFTHARTFNEYKTQLTNILCMVNISELRQNLAAVNKRIKEYSSFEYWYKVIYTNETSHGVVIKSDNHNLFKLSMELNHQSMLYFDFLGNNSFAMTNNRLFDNKLISFRMFKTMRRLFYQFNK